MDDTVTEQVRPDGREMAMVHGVFRRALADCPTLIEAVAAGDTARVQQLAAHLRLVLTALYHHHDGEDELVWPLLLERAPLETALVDAMCSQHAAVASALERARDRVEQWAASADPADGATLAQALTDLAGPLLAHLDEEEHQVVPLICAHLSVPEWERLRDHAMAQTSPEQNRLFLGMMIESLSPVERAKFFAKMPPPMAARWADAGQPAFDAYITAIRAG